MASLKEIRVRIASVQSTQKITSAMKMVSASKLRRAQMAIINLRPYSNKLNEILQNLSGNSDSLDAMPLFQVREPQRVALVVISSNRGLCGAFNTNIVKKVDALLKEEYASQRAAGNVQLYCIGKKAKEQLSKEHEIAWSNEELVENSSFEEISRLAEQLMADFMEKKIDVVQIIYNRFVNQATQMLVAEDFLPIRQLETQGEGSAMNHDYIFEPDQESILTELIPKILKLQLYKTLLDSIASEHGARMTAMHKATDNATEILKDLRLKYNNARQSSITNELIEIVSGAEALNN
ncbi:MAG: ATP synthase F1 subunit gamma [Bacteroidales bacterium]|nr:ATP synthase F1 subunit gamma [Bacteroidales bacterium]